MPGSRESGETTSTKWCGQHREICSIRQKYAPFSTDNAGVFPTRSVCSISPSSSCGGGSTTSGCLPPEPRPVKTETVQFLRCPATGQPLRLTVTREESGRVREGELVTADASHRYPICEFVPRFVPESNYADNFGLQWNRFRCTQLDSVSGLPISEKRFYQYSKWSPEELAGKRVLDVGCGAGRFAEIALKAGAEVVAVDYSSAVNACQMNLAGYDSLEVIQGDVFNLPFERESFDYVY